MESFYQNITYDYVPKYCKHCYKLGHDLASCKYSSQNGKNTNLKSDKKGSEKENKSGEKDADKGNETAANGEKDVDSGKATTTDMVGKPNDIAKNIEEEVESMQPLIDIPVKEVIAKSGNEKESKKMKMATNVPHSIRFTKRNVVIPMINQILARKVGTSSSGDVGKDLVASGLTTKDVETNVEDLDSLPITNTTFFSSSNGHLIDIVDKSLFVQNKNKGASDSELVDTVIANGTVTVEGSPSPRSPKDWPELNLDGNSSYTGGKHYGSDGFTVVRSKERNKQKMR